MPISVSQKKLILALTLVLLGLSIFPAAAATQKQGVSMAAGAAFQGHFKYGEWLPIWVNLENAGTDLNGEILVSVTRDFEQITYAVPVSLANGARKRVPLYVQPNNFSHELKVDLVVEDGLVATQMLKVQPHPNINYLIGVAATERGALALLPGIQLPGGRLPVLMDVSLELLPEQTAALRSLDSLILNDVDTSQLTPEQIDAIRSWIQQGGRLIIGGGAGAFQTTEGLPLDLLPLQPTDLIEADDLSALSEFADATPILVPGPFVLATGDQTEGETLLAQDGTPLIQEISIGEGTVTFIALDLSSTPFDAWTGTTNLWEKVFSTGARFPSWQPPDMSRQQMIAGPISNALSNLPSLDLPSARNVAVLLGIYILLVGPVNYFVLRWRKRLHWAWITIPAITLVFTGLSFGIAYARRGTDLIINKIAVIHVQPEGPAQVNSYIGLFSPANQSYEIEVGGKNLLSPISGYYSPWMSSMPPSQSSNNITFVQGDPSVVRGLTVNQWSMQSFMTETTLAEIERVQAEVYFDGENLVGTITNTSGYPLKDLILVLRPSFVRLGNLAPGESTEIKMSVANLNDQMMGGSISWRIYENEFNRVMTGPPPREIEFKRMILEALLDQQFYYGVQYDPTQSHSALELAAELPEITLIGWMDTAPPEIRINGQAPQEAETGIYLTQIPIHFPETGEVHIPPGLLPGLIAEMPFTGGTCGMENTSIWLEKGEAVFEFVIPLQFADLDPEHLEFSIRTDGGWANAPEMAIYNWESENWSNLENAKIGNNIIPDPEENISTDGLVRFRLSVNNQNGRGGGCYYFGLGLKGDL